MAYRKTLETEEILKTLEKDEEKTDFHRIRCPLCQWKPNGSSRWYCADCDAPENFFGGFLMSWKTFETRGKCPTCTHQWRCGGAERLCQRGRAAKVRRETILRAKLSAEYS